MLKQNDFRIRKESIPQALYITALSAVLSPVACLECGAEPCENADCRTRPLWKKLNTIVNEYLDSVTLADLMVE